MKTQPTFANDPVLHDDWSEYRKFILSIGHNAGNALVPLDKIHVLVGFENGVELRASFPDRDLLEEYSDKLEIDYVVPRRIG